MADSPGTTDPALGGPLWVSPPAPRGSRVVVATDALLAQTERLTRLHLALSGDAVALDRVDALGVGALAGAVHGPATAAARRSASQLDQSRAAIRAAADLARRTDDDLRQAISAYSSAEDEQHAAALRLGSIIGTLWGPAIRLLLISALPGILIARAAGLGADDVPLGAMKQWLLDHPGVITDPAFVEGVRVSVMSVDDAAGSLVGLPPGAVAQMSALYGFTEVEAGALITIAVGRTFGLFGESAVSVNRVATALVAAPASGTVDRLSRVPEGDQVRIERYDAPGLPSRFVVYVGPTETFSPVARVEPWDLTSNVTGVAGLEAASLRATELAMHDAGIRTGDEVQFVGFSQGGLIATRLAASGQWDAAGLETYGSPSGNITLPAGLDGMAIRNSDDFVPALAGPQIDHHLLQVERRAFAADSPIPTAEPVPAHQREAYVATATVVDAASSDAVREQIAAMDAFTSSYAEREGSSITVMTYHAERGGTKSIAPTTSAPATSFGLSGSIP